MKFSAYHISPFIKQSLEELGYNRPTDIQYKAIPSILKGEDVLAIAQTGTGKTAAFAIPVIELISKRKEKYGKCLRCLVMVPTHELAIQIANVFDSIAKYMDITTVGIFGGVAQDPHLHFEVRQNGQAIDPQTMLSGQMLSRTETSEALQATAGSGMSPNEAW